MKWISKRPVCDDRRFVKRFLFFPLKLQREVRWLETAYLSQRWNVTWETENFITKETYDKVQNMEAV